MARLVDPSGQTGIVLNIQRYCSHDGPGIRTNVFLKGCSLRCKWCGNPESIASKPELSYDPKKCIGKKECGLCLKAPFPEGAFYVPEGAADDKVKVNWDLAMDCDEAMVSLCPTEGALHVRQADDRGRGAGRGGEGRLLLPLDRGRHHPERRRVPAAAGLQRRLAEGRPRARHQHGDRNGVQRALGLRGKGAAPRRHDAPRPQDDDPGAAQEVDRRRQRADPGELQEGLRDVPQHRTSSPARR